MKQLINYLLLILLPLGLSAQNPELSPEVVAAAGDSFSSNNLLVEWTLGEIMTESFEGGLIWNQGFQQPIGNITSIENPFTNLGLIKVYPNPASNSLFVEKEKAGELKLSLRDIRGRILLESISSGQSAQLNISTLPPGIYILSMSDEKQASQNIRIQKL